MKNISSNNRTLLYLKAAIVTLSLALLAAAPAMLAHENNGKIIRPSIKATAAHHFGHTGGLKVDWSWWWIRR